jgi:hypothetical protein
VTAILIVNAQLPSSPPTPARRFTPGMRGVCKINNLGGRSRRSILARKLVFSVASGRPAVSTAGIRTRDADLVRWDATGCPLVARSA